MHVRRSLVGLAGALSFAFPSMAQEPSPAPRTEVQAPARVSVGFVAMGLAVELDAKTASWFVNQGVAYSSERLERFDADQFLNATEPGVHVLVTHMDPERLRLFFALRERTLRRYLVRDIALPSGLDEVGLENTAQVIFSASLALFRGGEETSLDRVRAALPHGDDELVAPLEPEPHEEATPAPPASLPRTQATAPTPPRSSMYLVTSLGYSVRYQEPEHVAHGPVFGLGVADRWLGLSEVGARLSGGVLLPDTLSESHLELDLRGYSLALEPWVQFGRGGSSRWLASLALGLDVVQATPRATSSQASVAAPSRTLDPTLTPRVAGYFDVGNLSVGAALELSFPLVDRHYDVLVDGEQQRWVDPWFAQPGISIHVAWRGRS